MGKLKGITVTLVDKTISGKDPFGNPIKVDFDIKIENVLVAPATTEDITNQLSLTGKKLNISWQFQKEISMIGRIKRFAFLTKSGALSA